MSEMKKCPFCGGEADYTQILGNYGRVYCFTCDGGIREGRSKDGVIHNWNNRPIEDALNARIAELEYQLEDWTNNGWAEDYKARIAELEAENETIISDYEERMDNLVNIGNETGRLLQAEIGYLNAQLGIKNLTTETLQLRIAELEAAQRWIPVSERLPEIGVRVLFYNNFIKNIHKGWYSGDEWVSEIGVFYNGDKLERITHWMPLPNPPEVQE